VFNLLERLPADVPLDSPGGERMSLIENLFDLLESTAGRLRKTEQDVDKRGEVERSEDEIGLKGDVLEARWDGPGEGEVERPVGGSSQRHGLGANTHRKYLGGVSPGDRAHSNGKAGRRQSQHLSRSEERTYEHTKRYEHTMTARVTPVWPSMTQTGVPSTSPQWPKPP
jgi:hypothetical protein